MAGSLEWFWPVAGRGCRCCASGARGVTAVGDKAAVVGDVAGSLGLHGRATSHEAAQFHYGWKSPAGAVQVEAVADGLCVGPGDLGGVRGDLPDQVRLVVVVSTIDVALALKAVVCARAGAAAAAAAVVATGLSVTIGGADALPFIRALEAIETLAAASGAAVPAALFGEAFGGAVEGDALESRPAVEVVLALTAASIAAVIAALLPRAVRLTRHRFALAKVVALEILFALATKVATAVIAALLSIAVGGAELLGGLVLGGQLGVVLLQVVWVFEVVEGSGFVTKEVTCGNIRSLILSCSILARVCVGTATGSGAKQH